MRSSSSRPNQFSPWLQLIGLITFYLVLVLPFLTADFIPEEFRDLRAYLAAGSFQTMFRDFSWPYGPLAPYFYGLIIRLLHLPHSLFALRIIFIVIGVLSLVLGHAVFRKIGSNLWTWLGPAFLMLAFFVPQYTYNNSLLIPFICAAWWLLLPQPQLVSADRLLASALCTAAVILIRPLDAGPGFLAGMLLTLYFTDRPRPWLRIMAFLFCAVIPVLAIYGGLYLACLQKVDFWEKVLPTFHGLIKLDYHNLWQMDWTWLRGLRSLNLHTGFVVWLGLADLLKRVVLLAFLVSPAVWLIFRRFPRSYLLFYSCLVMISLRMFYQGKFFDYLTALLFFTACLACAYAYQHIISKRLTNACRAIMLLVLLLHLPWREYYNYVLMGLFPRTYTQQSALIHAVPPHAAYRTKALRPLQTAWPKKAAFLDQAVDIIQARTAPQDRIFFFGYDPSFYSLAQRESVFPEDDYIVLESGLCFASDIKQQHPNWLAQSGWIKRMTERFAIQPPALFIVASDNFAPGITDANAIYAWMLANYQLVAELQYDWSYQDFNQQDKMVPQQVWLKIYQHNLIADPAGNSPIASIGQ